MGTGFGLLLLSMGCKKAVPIITGEEESTSPTQQQASFNIYPTGGSATNSVEQMKAVLDTSKVAFGTSSANGANNRMRAVVISK